MTKKHRRHSTAKKREVVEAYFNGESMRGLSQRYDIDHFASFDSSHERLFR